MTLFRPHRGTLADSMADAVPVHSWHDIAFLTGFTVSAIEPYGFDARIGWDTYIVLTDDMATPRQAIGFTNGPLENTP